ncbi:hypothetical protein [Acinetobacter sp. UBA801]|uniref:hypothetical protein n=1 Tax=Acinetobacter sp. UBA801 TaxID=1945958 RepID=UPI0025C51478|nr:hypothetical protein [Acinetobacter sp. UBA801]
MIQNFNANTQYKDYVGSVAADDADTSTLRSSLKKYFDIDKDEVIIGIKTTANYHGRSNDIENFTVTIHVLSDMNQLEKLKSGEAVSVNEYQKNISIQEYFKFFKRLEFTLSIKGEFENAKYEVINS